MRIMAKLRGLFVPRDLSVGTPWKRIAEFAFPMLVGNFAQQLYNTVDAVVVGRSKWGYTALAAVGNAGPVLNLLLALFVGIATGAGILVSQYFGARKNEELSKTIGNCISITAVATMAIMIIGPLVTGPMLRAMDTLPEVFDNSRDYLNIFFIGIGGFFFYNILTGILRGLGDSFSALVILFICSGLNVVGDLLLVDSMGVAGVALATVISQIISAVLCLIKLSQLKHLFTLTWKSIIPQKEYVSKIVRLGVPSGITQAVFSCAMLVVQALINSFGDTMFVACNVMVMRVDGYAMLPNFSFGQAMSTYTAQNVGARKIDRVYKGTKQGVIMALSTALVLVPTVLLLGPTIMNLFTPGNTELINMSMTMMYIVSAGYVAMSVTQCLSGVMRGAGDTITPMWISFSIVVLLRVPLAYTLVAITRNIGAAVLTQQKMIFVSLLSSWVLGMMITTIVFKTGRWKKKQIYKIESELVAEANQPENPYPAAIFESN
ncbi:MAG: MATE family efflux transporter [Ruminiclostridium sp.]|nr:MATE family efflux transporter [Ruminiclostridium sp.]